MTTGMNPSWVLSDEQRKKRFKKYRSDHLSIDNSIIKYPKHTLTITQNMFEKVLLLQGRRRGSGTNGAQPGQQPGFKELQLDKYGNASIEETSKA